MLIIFVSGKSANKRRIFISKELSASPDGLPDGENDCLLQVKIRGSNKTGLLQRMEKYMCVQVLVQLFCSKRISVIFFKCSYDLETKTANYFCILYEGDCVRITVTCVKVIECKSVLTKNEKWGYAEKAFDETLEQ